MAEVQQLKNLNTLATIRKATQDSIRPTILEIQRKMSALSKETFQIIAKAKDMLQLQRKQAKTQQSLRLLQKQMFDVREELLNMTINQAKQREVWNQTETKLRQNLQKFTEQKQKQAEIIQKINLRNQFMSKQMQLNSQKIKQRQMLIQDKFLKLSQKSQKNNSAILNSSQQMRKQFSEIKLKLQKQLKSSLQRLELLNDYQTQKQVNFTKFENLTEKIQSKISKQEFKHFANETVSQTQKSIQDIQNFFLKLIPFQSQQILLQLPKMRKQVVRCLQFQQQIHRAKQEALQIQRKIQQQLENEKNLRNQNQQQIDSKIDQMQKQKQIMQNKIHKALGLQSQLDKKIRQFSQMLKYELRQQNKQKMQKLYDQIKITFADKKEQQRQNQLNGIVQQRLKLASKATQVQQIANNLDQILSNYSTKISKIRSDVDLFQQRVRKDLQKFDLVNQEISSLGKQTGCVLSQCMEALLISSCLEIHRDSKEAQEIAFSTQKDGIIYQKFQKVFSQSGFITYRRKQMNSKFLRRSLVHSLISTYDQLMQSNDYLGWSQEAPSYFFKQQIQPTYQNLIQKDKISQAQQDKLITARSKDNEDTYAVTIRQGAMTSMDYSSSKRHSTVRSRKTSRYEDPNKFLAHKSARRVNGNLSYTLSIE